MCRYKGGSFSVAIDLSGYHTPLVKTFAPVSAKICCCVGPFVRRYRFLKSLISMSSTNKPASRSRSRSPLWPMPCGAAPAGGGGGGAEPGGGGGGGPPTPLYCEARRAAIAAAFARNEKRCQFCGASRHPCVISWFRREQLEGEVRAKESVMANALPATARFPAREPPSNPS